MHPALLPERKVPKDSHDQAVSQATGIALAMVASASG